MPSREALHRVIRPERRQQLGRCEGMPGRRGRGVRQPGRPSRRRVRVLAERGGGSRTMSLRLGVRREGSTDVVMCCHMCITVYGGVL